MLIFFYGNDVFRSHQKLVEIKDKYLLSDKSGSGLSSFDFSDKANMGEVLGVFSLPNLLAPKRLVIIKRLLGAASVESQKEMAEYIKKNKSLAEDKDLVVVFWEDVLPKKNNALFKLLEKTAKKQNFEQLTGAKLNQWIIKRIEEINPKSSISREALDRLVSYAGSDALRMESELQKLVNFSDSQMISEKEVEILVRADINANIFSTIDALAEGNKKKALVLIHQHLEKGEDPFYLFSMIVYQFRNMLKVADIKENNRFSEQEMARITKLHPFVIRKSLAQLRNFSLSRLKIIYRQLSLLDTQVKTGKIGMMLAIDKLVAEI